MSFDKQYWESKYLNDECNWDAGEITPPLEEYFNQIENKDIKILIPGCGNGYEAEYLYQSGFPNVYLLDWSESALDNFKERVPEFPDDNLILEDFFGHEDKYDLIIEQTFFCSIPREDRSDYAKKVYHLLKDGGKFAGLLFNHEFDSKEPPYGGNKKEYFSYFSPLFNIKTFQTAYNSIKPRAGREFFFIMQKKQIQL